MAGVFVFTDEDLESMLHHHGVIHIQTDDGKDYDFMSEKQYNRMHPEDPTCPHNDNLRKDGNVCGLMEFCNDCEWWEDFVKRDE